MVSRSWQRSLGTDAAVIVRRRTGNANGDTDTTSYRVEWPRAFGESDSVDFMATGDARISLATRPNTEGADTVELSVAVPENSTYERFIVELECDRVVLYLPSAAFLESCKAAIDGDEEAVSTVIDAFPTPVQIPFICGSFLSLAETIELIESLTHEHRHVESVIRSYRYDIVRGAIVSRNGLSVGSGAELETIVDGLDGINGLGDVRVVDALADVTTRVHGSISETKDLMTSLGYDLQSLERRDDGRFFVSLLAHLVVTDGFRAAEGHAMKRRWDLGGNYEQRKDEAARAVYGARGASWSSLICAAARESLDELAYVLANALYWTGEESRSDSRMPELLHQGAADVAATIGLDEVEYRARFARHVAAGHRNRRTHRYDLAATRFGAAKRLAAEHRFLPEWRPVLSRGIVRSISLQENGSHEEAVAVVKDTIERILACGLSESRTNEIIHHLAGRKFEVKAIIAHSNGSSSAIEFLENAHDHYQAIGFEQSRDRVRRKLQNAHRVARKHDEAVHGKSEASQEPTIPKSAESKPLPLESPRGSRRSFGIDEPWSETTPDDSGEISVPDHDWLDSIDYPHQPDDDDSSEKRDHDPYIF